MTDRTTSFKIGVEGDAGDIPAFLQSLRTQFTSAVRDIQTLTSKLNLFDSVQQDSQKAVAALAAAKDAVAALQAQIAKIQAGGGSIGDDLAASLKKAEQAAASAQKAFDSNQKQLEKLRTTLTAAGVDTTNLGAAQAKLAALLNATTNAAATQSAKDLLGFKSLDDVQPKIASLNAAFLTLKNSGTLSATEIQAAERQLADQITKVKAEVTDLGATGFQNTAASAKAAFSAVQASAIAVGLAISEVASKLSEASEAAREFETGIARIGSITNLSSGDLASIGEQARALARTFGVDVVDAVKDLYELIRTGVPADNAITALTAAAQTAKLSQASLGEATKLTGTLINQFGVQTNDVARVLDIFVQASHNGGATIAELSGELGRLAPIAKATNTPVEDIAAALQVMVKAGVPAGAAVNDLNRILTRLNTTAAQKALRDLGIQATGLVGTFQAISSKGLSIDELVKLGLASQKSAAGLAALANTSTGLSAALAQQKTAVEDAATALEKLEQTPQERIERLDAAFKDLKISVGEVVGAESGLAVVITSVLNRFNDLDPTLRASTLNNLSFSQTLTLMALNATSAESSLAKLQKTATSSGAALQSSVAAIQGALTAQFSGVANVVEQSRAGLATFAADLKTTAETSLATTQQELADLTTRANAEILSLDQSTKAQQATADATVAIQTKLAADRIALIEKGSKDAIAAINAQGQALINAARKNGDDETAVERNVQQQTLAVRQATISQIVKIYESQYADLLTREKGFVDQLNSIDQARVTFNDAVQAKLREIRNEGLSDFDAYIDKVSQINELLAKAQTSFQQGGEAGLTFSKIYITQAIALSETIKKVVDQNGTEVISSFDAQQQKIGLITKAADQYNAVLDFQKTSAQNGFSATAAQIDLVKPKLDDLRTQLDAINKLVEAGLKVKLDVDVQSVADLNAKIDAAVVDQKRLLGVQIDVSALTAQVNDLVAKIKAGTTDGVTDQINSIAGKIAALVEKAPELKIDPVKALDEITNVKKAIETLGDAKAKFTVDSNVADVQKDIDKLKLPTESTHTVHIVTEGTLPGGGTPGGTQDVGPPAPVPGFARGGPVGFIARHFPRIAERFAIAQQFAKGGPVFPRPNWIKVPGVGSGDTVPASLESGSFVVRKAASTKYGDAIMGHLATTARRINFLAGGGFGMNDRGTGVTVTDPKQQALADYIARLAQHNDHPDDVAPVIDPKLGYQPGDSFQSTQPPISFDTRPVPASLITVRNVVAYAREMLQGVPGGPLNPLLGILSTEIPSLIDKVQANPTDTTSLNSLLQAAETIGANPVIFSMGGKTASTAFAQPPEWFYDYLEKTQAGALSAALQQAGGAPAGGGSIPGTGSPIMATNNDFAKRFFASAGFGNAFYKQNPVLQVKKDTPLATIASELFASGGAANGTDTVPAMLTPGEFVINRESASVLGAPLLHAVNDMRITREDLASIVSGRYPGPAPSGPIHRFADGGAVDKVPKSPASPSSGGASSGASGPASFSSAGSGLDSQGGCGGGISGDVNINVMAPVQTIFSEANVRRYLLPALNGILNRSPLAIKPTKT